MRLHRREKLQGDPQLRRQIDVDNAEASQAEDVTLVYRKPSARLGRAQKNGSSTTSQHNASSPSSASGLYGDAASNALSSSAAASSPEKSVVAFFHRATGPANLSRYLTHCAVQDVQLRCSDQGVSNSCASDPSNNDGDSLNSLRHSHYRVTQEQIFQCSPDRFETAVQALWNMEALLVTPPDTTAASGTPWVGQRCWVMSASHQEAMVALARVCEAAVPLLLPSMVDSSILACMTQEGREKERQVNMAWTVSAEQLGAGEGRDRSSAETLSGAQATNGNEEEEEETAHATENDASASQLQDSASTATGASAKATASLITHTVQLLPSPVRLVDIRRRLHCLRRLHQLRLAYNGLLPRLRSASTLTQLCTALFEHRADACQTLGRLRQVWLSGDGVPPASAPKSDASTSVERSTQDVHNTSALFASTLRDASSAQTRALVELLSSYVGSPAVLDGLRPLVGISARHPQEEALLQHLVSQLKAQTAVDAATWGPMAAMTSWRCTDGVYVVQHAARVRTLRRVVAEAQFYGLPRFLRSIRVAAAGGGLGGMSGGIRNNGPGSVGVDNGREFSATSAAAAGAYGGGYGEDTWWKPTSLLRAQSRYADVFFLTPDALDPSSFAQPDSMQAQLVQEELITLQRTHGAFCLVVGEADEIVTLLHEHLMAAGRAWQHLAKKEEGDNGEQSGPVVKAEPAAGEDEEGVEAKAAEGVRAAEASSASAAHPVDPLHRYVLRTVDAARRHEREMKKKHEEHQDPSIPSSSTTTTTSTTAAAVAPLPFSHVQWVEGGSTNQWCPNTHYYGLVYMVVMETDEWETEEVSLVTEGLLPGTAIAIAEDDNDGSAAALRPPRPPTYCVNAMLELWRN